MTEEKGDVAEESEETLAKDHTDHAARGALAYFAGYDQGREVARREALGLPPLPAPPRPPPPPPPPCVSEVLAILATVTSSEREAVFEAVRHAYCLGCGDVSPRPDGSYCQCQNDE